MTVITNMMPLKHYITLLFSLLMFTQLLVAQTFSISGYVKDASSGEDLIGATVTIKGNNSLGTVTNAYGFYTLSLEKGTYAVSFSYVGYNAKEFKIDLTNDTQLNIELSDGVLLEGAVIVAESEDQNVTEAQTGVFKLPTNIKELPALLGEPDPIKIAKLGPGISSGSDISSGFYVRGGGADQNLVLLDEALVYNSGHILGFFSIFNPDALKNTTIYKGGMPANYGGRLSSVVDIQMKEGNSRDYVLEGGLGIVSSRLTFQGPIRKDSSSSFIVSGRRTYAYDLARPFLRGSDFEGTNYFFYDLNAKINHRLTEKDRLYLSGYFGRDLLDFASRFREANFGINYGNLTGTLRWNRNVNDRIFINTSLIYNEYQYDFSGREFGLASEIGSGVADWNVKVDVDYGFTPDIPFLIKSNHDLKYGINFIRHRLTPNFTSIASTSTDESLIGRSEARFANEYAAYVMDRFSILPELKVNLGLRVSAYTFFGPYESQVTGKTFTKDEIVTNYFGVEPRATATYILNQENSIKSSIALTNQYVHRVNNSASSLPLDIWIPSTDLVEPQRGWQASLGYFRNFDDNQYEFSVEAYYRQLRNQIDYGEDYVNDPTDEIEDQLVFGDGEAYGLEFFLRKRKGDFTGWVSYTLSRTQRTFAEVNEGRPYPATQDRPHDFSVVFTYDLNPKWSISGIYVFTSGIPFTPVSNAFLVEQSVNYQFGERNSLRIEPYHRFDFSATLTPNPEVERNFSSSWTFSIFNLYDRRNMLFYYFTPEVDGETGKAEIIPRKVSFFPVIPSVTWNFKWQMKKKAASK